MVEVQTERRLAAILVADVVGYSKLIQRDEDGTRSIFRRLEKNFFTPLVRAHRGRIIKSMGDAFLMEFSSAIHAVRCAIELQSQINLHLADESSLDIRGLQFRIGVNIGDIIVEGKDIHGDGVNVAARLQTCAEPGGICVSHTVHDQVRGKVDVNFRDYDRDLEDIFAVQDEITKSIVSVLPNRLRNALSEQIQRESTANYSAYEYFLHGRWLFINTAGTDPKAAEYLTKAIKIDPKYAQSHAVLANLYAYSRFSLGVWYEEPEAKARRYIAAAIKYGKNDPTIHTLVEEAYYWLGDHDKGRFHLETAMKLNPHDVQTMIAYGAVLNGSGESEEGLRWMDKALEMDPHVPDFSWESKVECLYMLRRYEESLKILLSWQDPPPHSYAEMAACYAHLGQMDKAYEAAEKFRSVCAKDENFPRFAAAHASICKRDEDKENWLSGYRMAGLLD